VRRLTRNLFKWVAVLCIAALAAPLDSSAASHAAGLVVIQGDGSSAWVYVPFDEESISGAELVHRSGLAVTEVSFGGLGIGICGIEGNGCDISECRKRLCHGPANDDPYWQYFLGGTDGTWKVAALGVSSDTIHDGDVRAFIWSASAPTVAAPTVAEMAVRLNAPQTGTVSVQRFGADGSIISPARSHKNGTPWFGLVAVAVAVLVATSLGVNRRRRSERGA
jgi:hypothetical protein